MAGGFLFVVLVRHLNRSMSLFKSGKVRGQIDAVAALVGWEDGFRVDLFAFR